MRIDEPSVHLDHMLKQTRQHHVQLSTMADFKANMLITIASVLLTLTGQYVFTPQATQLPAAILMIFCLFTIVLAAYAVMPKLFLPFQLGGQMPHQPTEATFNPLFFGDFVCLDEDTYVGVMEGVLNDPCRYYEIQVREVYQIGMFLARKKYRYLQWAYISFITGFLLSGITLVFTRFF